jgi:hypothetical protein
LALELAKEISQTLDSEAQLWLVDYYFCMKKTLLKKGFSHSSSQDSSLPALRPTMLLVLGMHRSGTSVTARLLECLGAKNSENLTGTGLCNPHGYFEDNDVYKFNDSKLLPRLDRAWHSTSEVDWSNLSDADRSKYALQALEIVKKNYPLSNTLSVLKEPRLGILVPFWLAVLQHAGFNTKVVCAVRDPVSVIRSLNKAEGLSLPHAGMVFINYWLSILKYCKDLEVAFFQYDEIFELDHYLRECCYNSGTTQLRLCPCYPWKPSTRSDPQEQY